MTFTLTPDQDTIVLKLLGDPQLAQQAIQGAIDNCVTQLVAAHAVELIRSGPLTSQQVDTLFAAATPAPGKG